MVPVPEVGELVGEHMGADCSVRRRLRGEVDGGAEHPAQAGGGQTVRLIHRQGTARRGEGAAAFAELLGKMQVGDQHRQQHRPHSRRPEGGEQGGGRDPEQGAGDRLPRAGDLRLPHAGGDGGPSVGQDGKPLDLAVLDLVDGVGAGQHRDAGVGQG